MTTSSQFTIAPYSLEEIGKNGGGTVKTRVLGFWSEDVMTLYVSRKSARPAQGTERTHEWTCEISHSSGGRDPKDVADGLEAEVNFAQALIALAAVGMGIRQQADKLEAAFQRQWAAQEVQLAEEARAKAERVAADAMLGRDGAMSLLYAARKAAVVSGREAVVTAFPLGESRPGTAHTFRFNASRSGSGRVTVRHFGNVIGNADLIKTLAGYSARSHIATEAA